jgi:hypothetical protein
MWETLTYRESWRKDGDLVREVNKQTSWVMYSYPQNSHANAQSVLKPEYVYLGERVWSL